MLSLYLLSIDFSLRNQPTFIESKSACRRAISANRQKHKHESLQKQPTEQNIVQKSLNIDPDKCTGCLQCEMACSLENEGVFNTAKSRIKVFSFHEEGKFVPYTCTQCDDAWCMHACPVDAIVVNAVTGSKDVVADLCVGCKVCTIACPFGTVNYNTDSGKVVKCDLCGGDPQCASACPTDAITYIDANATGLDKMRQWASKTDNATAGS